MRGQFGELASITVSFSNNSMSAESVQAPRAPVIHEWLEYPH